MVNPSNPYTLMYADGTPFFLVGDTLWSFSTAAISWPDEFQTYVGARSNQGFNYVHGDVYQQYPDWNDGNEGGQAFIGNNVDQLNPGFWQNLDQRIAYMNENGIVLGFLLTWANDGWNRFQNEVQVERFAQYVINRYGAFNLIWIIEGEYEEWRLPGGHNNLGNYFMDNDPYGHLRTIHTIDTSSDDFGSEPWHTLIYQQIVDPGLITADRSYGKPVVNSEFGYEGDYSADIVRKRAWEIVMRGGYFVYGNRKTFHYNASMTHENLYSPGALYISYLKDFFTNKLSWWEMQPANGLVTGAGNFVLERSGREFVVYMKDGGTTSLDLSNALGDLESEWFSPRTGEYHTGISIPGGGTVSIAAPDGNDWVLHAWVSTSPTPAPAPSSTPTPAYSASPTLTSKP